MTEPPPVPPGVNAPFTPMSAHQFELQRTAIEAGTMLAFALEQVQAALAIADEARENLEPAPAAERLAGALIVGDLKMREALGFVRRYGQDAVDAIRDVFGLEIGSSESPDT